MLLNFSSEHATELDLVATASTMQQGTISKAKSHSEEIRIFNASCSINRIVLSVQ